MKIDLKNVARQTDVEALLAQKVSKVEGKTLTTNDYTNVHKSVVERVEDLIPEISEYEQEYHLVPTHLLNRLASLNINEASKSHNRALFYNELTQEYEFRDIVFSKATVGLSNVDNVKQYPNSNPLGFKTASEIAQIIQDLKDRANHEGTIDSSVIADLFESVQGVISQALSNVDNIKQYPNSNPLGFEKPSQLAVRDLANRNRSNHSGQQYSDSIADLQQVVYQYVTAALFERLTDPTEVPNSLKLTGVITPPPILLDTHNYSPANLGYSSVLRLSSAKNIELTGLLAQPAGTVKYIFNVGLNDIKLKKFNILSFVNNQFGIKDDATIAPNESAALYYDGVSNKWRLISKF